MTAAAYSTYSGMIDRGTCDLALIDSALAKKYVTLDEANKLRARWHSTYDVAGLAVTVADDRTQSVTWSAPNMGTGRVSVTRTAGDDVRTVAVAPTARPVSFPAPAGGGEVAVTVTAVVTATNGYLGPESSAGATVPAVPAPAPTPTPTPEPTPPAPEPAPEPAPATGAGAGTTDPTTGE